MLPQGYPPAAQYPAQPRAVEYACPEQQPVAVRTCPSNAEPQQPQSKTTCPERRHDRGGGVVVPPSGEVLGPQEHPPQRVPELEHDCEPRSPSGHKQDCVSPGVQTSGSVLHSAPIRSNDIANSGMIFFILFFNIRPSV